jgi:hypothetical protein
MGYAPDYGSRSTRFRIERGSFKEHCAEIIFSRRFIKNIGTTDVFPDRRTGITFSRYAFSQIVRNYSDPMFYGLCGRRVLVSRTKMGFCSCAIPIREFVCGRVDGFFLETIRTEQ